MRYLLVDAAEAGMDPMRMYAAWIRGGTKGDYRLVAGWKGCIEYVYNSRDVCCSSHGVPCFMVEWLLGGSVGGVNFM